MNPYEAAKLITAVKASAPAQRFTDEAPEAWALALAEVTYQEAADVLGHLSGRHDWITPKLITEAVTTARRERRNRVGTIEPNVDPVTDPDGYRAEARALTTAIREGRFRREHVAAYQDGKFTLTGPDARKQIGAGP